MTEMEITEKDLYMKLCNAEYGPTLGSIPFDYWKLELMHKKGFIVLLRDGNIYQYKCTTKGYKTFRELKPTYDNGFNKIIITNSI